MTNSKKIDPRIPGLFLLAFGILASLGGLPFIIAGSLFDNSTHIFWRAAGLIMGTLFVLGVSISFILNGIAFIVEDSYPDKEYLRVYGAVLALITLAIGFICYRFLIWIATDKDKSFMVTAFWITAIITFVLCLGYSYKKIQNRLQEVSEHAKEIDKYLEDMFTNINNKKLTYGAAFLKVEKEISERHFKVQCTNKIIFAYHKLTKDEKEHDHKAFLNDKSTLLNFYPLKSDHK